MRKVLINVYLKNKIMIFNLCLSFEISDYFIKKNQHF